MSGGTRDSAEDAAAAKTSLRRRAKAARAAAHADDAAAAAEAAAARFLEAADQGAIGLTPGAVVSGYRPIRDELDPTPLMRRLIARGVRLCAPVIEGDAAPLSFRAWSPESEMMIGAFGAAIPRHGDSLSPELLIIPLLAFDRSGARLGYGGGHFDRSLELLRRRGPVQAIGFAFAAQEMTGLPQEPTDQRLDAVVTEREAIIFPR